MNSHSYSTRLNPLQALANLLLNSLHVKVGLKVHPELRGLPQIPAKPEGNISGYRPGTVNNITNPHGRYANVMRKMGLRNTHLPYNLSKYHTGMYRLKVSSHDIPPFLVTPSRLSPQISIVKPDPFPFPFFFTDNGHLYQKSQ